MTRTPSRTLNAPAATAAATSPMEWPITAAGSTPWDRHIAARPNWMAKITGCTRSNPVTTSGRRRV
ncbi:hypothetical protein [Streptomyces sp. CB03238]|uniref:hypothetical protein n=1 Tax=Streptomyces sp. CB03238 TaxID=1907777 RepID=UPI00240A720A|nr:hypothetical protein [Streptomyces sp. CB03238]